MGKIY